MSDPILVGSLVGGRYRIVRRLGAGGMGTVYVAVQEPLGREVALKVVRRDLSGDERAVERFRREAMTLSQAHHPHIVNIFDFGDVEGGALYFAMELVRGETLRQRLQRSGPMTVKKSIALVRDVAAALACAHELGIIHRDLKPENILLMDAAGEPDFVKIVDFGVAKLVREDDGGSNQEALTQHGSVVGTPGYIAPEVALRGITTDVRSDLYALGVVWFECLAGRQPFYAKTATALLMAHALDPVPSLPGDIPLPVAGLVQRLLAKGPEDRPASAEELSTLLDALPIIDSNAGLHLAPLSIGGNAQASAATIDEVRAPPSQPMRTEVALPTEASDAPVVDVERERLARAPTKVPTQPTQVPAHLATHAPDRRSILAAAALIGGAIVVAAIAMAFLLRTPPANVVDAGVPVVAHANDAGTSSTPAAHTLDAGVTIATKPTAAQDAGPRPTKKHGATTTTQKHDDSTEHVPDLSGP